MARVAFYDPYLDVLGGGEKYLLTILEEVARGAGGPVLVLSPGRPEPEQWRRLNLEIDARRLRWRRASQLSAMPLSAGADLLVTLTNHFPPLSLARRSAVIVQYPFASVHGEHGERGVHGAVRWFERTRRLRSYDSVLCYSEHVAAAIRERLNIDDPIVIAPPVDLPDHAPTAPKDHLVLAVGRFFPAADANNKKHEVLIEAWRELQTRGRAPGWELHLAGGVHADPESTAHLQRLRERARGLAIAFHPDASPEALRDLYQRSALFWHAAGFGETRPERHEHFGITTVEGMAHGCVPVVIGLGGQREIVTDGVNGRLWGSVAELVAITSELIADSEQTERLRRAAARDASQYGKGRFIERIKATILTPAGVGGG